jgi:hypothetical protein
MADKTMHDRGPGAKKPELAGGEVPAGGCLSGWVTFIVPDDEVPAAVLYDGSSRIVWTLPPPKGAKGTKPATPTTTAKASTTTTTAKPATATTTAMATTSTTAKATTAKATTTTSKKG